MDVRTQRSVERAAQTIHEHLGPEYVVVTGGHADAEAAADCWFDGNEVRWLSAKRQPYAVHGAGDTFSAALTVGLAHGCSVERALRQAKAFATEAIRHAPNRGHGHRPLAHGVGADVLSSPSDT
jgi:hydroxymethylpyrimidine kinase/phosphomethylpyrimidine kinase